MNIPGQIVYCKMVCATKSGKILIAKPFVYAYPYVATNELSYLIQDDKLVIRKFNVKEDLIIKSIEIISYHGFKNKSKEFTEVKKSDEKRNTITGAYE